MTETTLDFTAIKQGAARHRQRPVPCEVTREQEQLWTETRTLLLLTCPAFTHILYTMMNPRKKADVILWTKECPIAATDGVTMMLNPDGFFKYTLAERVFASAHEICHCIFNHCGMMYVFSLSGKIGYVDGTFLPYVPKIFNVAADLVINAMLIKANVGKFNPDWLFRPDISGDESVIDVYRKIYKEAKGRGGSTKIQGESFDEHLPPGTTSDGEGEGESQDPTEAVHQRNETEWKTAVAAAVASAKAQGMLPGNLEAVFGELLEPVVSWREHVQAFLARMAGSGGYNWQRADRRLIVRGMTPQIPGEQIFAPGRSGFGCGTIVMVGDTSGSIDYRLGRVGDKFLSEMAGLLEELRPKRLVIIWCDAEVRRVDEVEDASDMVAVRFKGAPGRGGTDFKPPFEEVEKMGITPDALIYLTDGYGPFPAHAPNYPVLWGSITDVVYPFGDVVDLTALNE